MNHHHIRSKALIPLLGVGVALVLGACSGNSESQASTTSTTGSSGESATSIDMTSAIKDASWNPTITITYSGESITFEPDGIPNHERDEYYAVPNDGVIVPDATSAHVMKDPTKPQTYSFDIPSVPEYSSTTTKTSLGSIGVMISGAVLYNPNEGDGSTVAMANNFTITDDNGITASFVDKCAGHPTPDMGAYHYHGLPNCVTEKVDTDNGASHIIGIALDGFPIYGANDINGKPVDVKDLDECNGIDSPTPEFPSGIYHYVLPGTNDASSSISCLHGTVDTSQIQPMPNMGPMPDLDAAAQILGITVDQLRNALNDTRPPDFATAAKKLGVTESELKAALGVK